MRDRKRKGMIMPPGIADRKLQIREVWLREL